jgi:uncharacterized protein (TIGR00661 family)
MLAPDHECLVLAPASVYQFMASATQHWPTITLHLLPSLSFQYRESGRLSYWRSALAAAPFILRREQLLHTLSLRVEAFAPDLAVTDFEPLLPRVARRLGIRALSLDHQHFLHAMDMSVLPPTLRRKALFLRPTVKMFCPSADRHLVSSFFRYPQRRGADACQQIGVLLRQDLRNATPKVGESLLVYMRRDGAADWLDTLAQMDCPVTVYGTGQTGCVGNLAFKPISAQGFIEDLASCRALLTTAGNQLVGEALALRKPILTVPEKGNFEQQLNGFFLNRSGFGLSVDSDALTIPLLQDFLAHEAQYKAVMETHPGEGNGAVLQAIRGLLPGRQNIPLLPQGMAEDLRSRAFA